MEGIIGVTGGPGALAPSCDGVVETPDDHIAVMVVWRCCTASRAGSAARE
jgi:hypothetical protein